jgi:hypothetical protein
LYPWLPGPLASKFASLWASSGDANLALAELRQDDLYETYYPGIRRPDGTLRMSEAEYASSKEAYSNLLAGYGLNPSQFSSWYTRWIEGEKSPQEVAAELGATYEGLVANIPEVRQYYAERWGIDMSDQAIFASILDSDVAAGILSRRIAVAQIGGEGLARGFDVADPFAERLAAAGIDQGAARGFFSEAEGRLPSLDEMARRFRDPDSTFDLEEFADAAVFGGAAQTSRIRRLLASEQSLFTDQTGGLAMNNELGVTGLRAI